jgi:hypothetical protein
VLAVMAARAVSRRIGEATARTTAGATVAVI